MSCLLTELHHRLHCRHVSLEVEVKTLHQQTSTFLTVLDGVVSQPFDHDGSPGGTKHCNSPFTLRQQHFVRWCIPLLFEWIRLKIAIRQSQEACHEHLGMKLVLGPVGAFSFPCSCYLKSCRTCGDSGTQSRTRLALGLWLNGSITLYELRGEVICPHSYTTGNCATE